MQYKCVCSVSGDLIFFRAMLHQMGWWVKVVFAEERLKGKESLQSLNE